MNLIQFTTEAGSRAVASVTDGQAVQISGVATTYGLAQRAIIEGRSLAEQLATFERGPEIPMAALIAEQRLLPPLDHPDPAHLFVTGTGLTHLGSAATRDSMHKTAAAADTLTDSMRMFRMGLEGGKPAEGVVGVQPEWFYKGTGHSVVAPEQAIPSPAFADDAGEEPEIAGLYVIGPDGTPYRLGFALANEFSDHVTERVNYLWLAHSKLRSCSYGPELRVGPLPGHVEGTSRIMRNGATIWEKPFLSGEDNMSHTIANLEHHHFKYPLFRQPGDVHVHMFGTATLSFADGVRTEPGDVFEISAPGFGAPLRNSVSLAPDTPVQIRGL